jgi:hypothetical protein
MVERAKDRIDIGIKLYYVISYYQTFIAIMKAMLDKESIADIIISDAIPDYDQLVLKLRKNAIFRRVVSLTEKEFVLTRREKFKLSYHKKNKLFRFFMGKLMWLRSQSDIIHNAESRIDLKLSEYEDIFVFGEGRSFAPFLYAKRVPFILVEDALDYYQMRNNDDLIGRNRMVYPRKYYWYNSLLDFIGLYYYMGGYSNKIKAIEVNDDRNLIFIKRAKRKIVAVPRERLYDDLTENQKKIIYNTFIGEGVDPIKFVNQTNNAYIIFTNPLFFDKTVTSENQAIAIYRLFIEEFCKEADVIYLKPHPRDSVNYSILKDENKHDFVILSKNMPSEIIRFNSEIHFKKALAISSTAVDQAHFADQRINVGMYWLDRKLSVL